MALLVVKICDFSVCFPEYNTTYLIAFQLDLDSMRSAYNYLREAVTVRKTLQALSQ